MSATARPYGFWLAVLRVYTGVFWVAHALTKIIDPNFGNPDGDVARLVTMSISSSSGLYQHVLVDAVQPHLVLFATVLTYGEVLIGLSLILGVFSRFGAFGGVLVAALYWLMSGEFATIAGYATGNAAVLVLSLTCVVLPVGMSFGVDGVRARRRQKPTPQAVEVPVLANPDADDGSAQEGPPTNDTTV